MTLFMFSEGDIIANSSEALVNAVNTVGVMGKGVALAFRKAFPQNCLAYKEACDNGRVGVGKMFVTEERGRIIINFPTKEHWRNPSKIEWVNDGLQSLRQEIEMRGIKTIAIPALGCGNGGLDWGVVRHAILQHLLGLPELIVTIYEPQEKMK